MISLSVYSVGCGAKSGYTRNPREGVTSSEIRSEPIRTLLGRKGGKERRRESATSIGSRASDLCPEVVIASR